MTARVVRRGATLLGAVVLALSLTATAEESPMHPGALAHALDRVAHTGRVLYVAAHPDDENTRLLAYLANARHLTVGYLSLTRGEGGQNLIGTEHGELLGVIRTQELLAARELDGAVQRFTTVRDFGYSKRAEEALEKWGHEEALADVVWVIRSFQPDVIITRFDERPPNHGHHTASAILAREAMVAAADPNRFPEQLQRGVTPWKVERLMHNVSPWRDTPPADALALDVGGYDVRLGLSYGELAARSRTQHKSQGFGSSGERGPLLEHFIHVAGSRPKKDLLEGIDLGWSRFGDRATLLIAALGEARSKLVRDAPEDALPALSKAHAALEAMPEGPRRDDAKVRLEALMQRATGLFLRATSAVPAVAPGTSVEVKLEAVLRRAAQVQVARVRFPGVEPRPWNKALPVHEKLELTQVVRVPSDAPVSAPYWLSAAAVGGRHAVADPARVGAPEAPASLEVEVELRIAGRTMRTLAPVVHTWTDRVHGERERRVLVTPPATVTPLREAVMLTNGNSTRMTLRLRSAVPGVKGEVRLPLPEGWRVTPKSQAVSLQRAGDETLVHFEVRAPKGAKAITVAPELAVDGKTWAWREDVIDYGHIPLQVVLQPSSVRLVPLELRIPRGRVGYVEGSGDTIREDLAHVGVRIEAIDSATLRAGDLQRYSAIIVGIRAYNTREDLRAAHPRLMRYVEGGGTVVVQYNTVSRWDPLDAELGPYPLTLGRDRVTDENADVVALNPKHPVLTTPNRLGREDWEGWVQERGLYFAEKWDPRYAPLFRMADPDEAPLEGSTLVANVGKGRYVYSGLSFFRQLPAGVPGAYRLLVNLIGAK